MGWSLSINRSTLFNLAAVAAAIAVVAFFRFYRLDQVPPEMNSDHAEKIMDILRVLAGGTSIFFPNNGGREAGQMYLVAGLHKYFGVPLNFMGLKLATTLVGFLALPFIYLLGKEIASHRVGLLAFLFAGVAYWPNVVARAGMRLPFYILFTAATLYFLLRGIRRGSRNDFIWAGVSLGLSFYGYSADRILPLLVALAIGLYLIHPLSSHRRTHIVVSTLALVAVSLVLFLPLLRYILSEPDSFLLRTLTRMGPQERQLAGPAIQIFLSNMGKALAMFSWSDGEIWVVSVPGYPALGIISGALFYLGAMLLLVRFLRHRHWLDIFLLLSIPVLMLPSTLSLAFPAENPNLYRTGGALVPVFLMAALALDGLMRTITAWLSSPWGKRVAWGLAIFLLAISAAQDYNLVFNKYYQLYQLSAWNTSEMGEVARGFVQSVGTPDNVWLMGFPHWVDSRLVPITAGFPGRDYALFVDQLPETEKIPGPKLFLVNPQDQAAIEALQQTYPRGWFQLYKSKVETKDFLIFFVPPQGSE
jgi:hypothetical protein